MKNTILRNKPGVALLAVLVFTTSSLPVFARDHDRGRDVGTALLGLGVASALVAGAIVESLPERHRTVIIDGDEYYYDNDVYYRSYRGGYVVVDPPVRHTVVREVPPDFVPVIVNGNTYYLNNGTYYTYTSYGYQAVPPPTGAEQAVSKTVAPVVSVPSDTEPDTLKVNIPNSHGGYNPVVIRRSGKGFTGPQGEYYNDFPTVEQLKVMYGK